MEVTRRTSLRTTPAAGWRSTASCLKRPGLQRGCRASGGELTWKTRRNGMAEDVDETTSGSAAEETRLLDDAR